MLRRAGIGLALRAPRLGPCTQPRTGRFRWLIGIAHGPSAVEGSQKFVRPLHSAAIGWMNFLRLIPRHRPLRALHIECSPPVGHRPSGTDQPAEHPIEAYPIKD